MTHFSSFSLRYSTLDPISCNELSENVNVIYGSNEAGKSRVRDFLEWIMFASSEEVSELKTAAAKKAFAHLDHSLSGTASIDLDGQIVTLTQQFVDNISQSHISSSHLRASDVSRALTDGLSRDHYNNVFSLTLDELTQSQSNKLITEDELMNMFFGAALSGSGISPPALLSELTKQRDEMYSEAKQAKNKRINRIFKELNESSTAIKQLRAQEKGLETIDGDLLELRHKLEELDIRIADVHQRIATQTKLINSADEYETYELLSNADAPSFNSELISRIVDINMLVHTCKELMDQGDQKEKDRITTSLAALKTEHALQYEELRLTVSPDSLLPTVRSPHFMSVIESEDRNRSTYATEIKSIKDQVAQYSKDIGLLTKASEQLILDINKAAKSSIENTASVTEPAQKTHRTARTIGAIAAAIGTVAFFAGFAFGQPALWIFGALVACGSGAFALLPPKSSPEPVIDMPASNELYVQQMNRELSDKHATIDDLNSRINTLLDDQKEKDSQRELNLQTYIAALASAGFPRDTTPHLASLYLDSFKDYTDRAQRIIDLTAALSATSTRLDAVFTRAENLRELAQGTECETSSSFETLEDVHAWAKSLHDIAVKQKKQEEQLHQKENQLREIEKNLSANFLSVENARSQYSDLSLSDVRLERTELVTSKDELESERKEIDHAIVRLDEQRRAASSSTEIADATQRSQQLVDELREAHIHYRGLYVAQQSVSKALEAFRQDNQPELLRVASRMLSSITRGEWIQVTVEQSLTGKEPVIRVLGDRAPHGLLITQLSRGTLEQLYLCLRLALMQTSHRGKHVPALFDDIAVNSDRARFEALAPVIGEIGRDRQVIYFTCHETTRDILAQHAGARIHTI